MNNSFFEELANSIRPANEEPSPDLVTCSDCQQQFKISECPTEIDGDWETGYYDVPMCPNCEDGGCLDSYDYSPEQLEEYEKWERKNWTCESECGMRMKYPISCNRHDCQYIRK